MKASTYTPLGLVLHELLTFRNLARTPHLLEDLDAFWEELNPFWPTQEMKNWLSEAIAPNTLIEQAAALARADYRSGEKRQIQWVGALQQCVGQKYVPATTVHLPVRPLGVSTLDFPSSHWEHEPSHSLKELWEQYCEGLSKISASTPVDLADAMIKLAERYAHCVPDGSDAAPDLSLSAYMHAGAGIAYALSEGDGSQFLLISADLSGIQNYLYDITSRKAARLLKGRSFYLQALSDSVLHLLRQHLKLPHASIIYASGGGFMLLAPHTPSIIQDLQEIAQCIQKRIFQAHGSSLSVEIGYIVAKFSELEQQGFKGCWKRLLELLRSKKRQRLKNQILHQYDELFAPDSNACLEDRDQITNEPILINPQTGNPQGLDYGEEGFRVSFDTHDQLDTARDLRKADYLLMCSHNRLTLKNNEWRKPAQQPGRLQVYYYFLTAADLEFLPSLESGAALYRLNGNAEGQLDLPNWTGRQDLPYPSHMLYGGRTFPLDAESQHPKNFEDLAAIEEDADFKRLGVLRMDVDSLGERISEGWPGKVSLTRMSAFSRALDWFFKGHLDWLRTQGPRFAHWVSLIYAGGDDLFVVGRWDAVAEFAKAVREAFKKWSGQNPMLSLSGGLAIVTSKFPIARAALLSSEEEDRAKLHSLRVLENGETERKVLKDALSLLGHPLNWDYELKEAESRWLHFEDSLAGDKGINMGFLTRMQLLASEARQAKPKQGESEYWAWRWKIAWEIGRLETTLRERKKIQAANYIAQLGRQMMNGEWEKTEHIKSKYTLLDIVALAARWASFLNRARTQRTENSTI